MTQTKVTIDFNTLFNLTYTFEPLKLILEEMQRNQDDMSSRLKAVEEELQKTKKEKDNFEKAVTQYMSTSEKKFKSVEITLNNMRKKASNQKDKSNDQESKDPLTTQRKKETKESAQTQQQQEEKETDKIEEQANLSDAVKENDNESKPIKNGEEEENEEEYGYENENLDENLFMSDNIEIEELKKRVTELEKKMKNKNLMMFSSAASSSNELELQQAGLKTLSDKFEDLKAKTDVMEKDIEGIKVKVTDFNIYDLFKDCTIEGGNLDASKLLIMSLENKVFKKFDITDEKLRKDQEDLYRCKNDVINIKNQNEVNQRTLSNLKEEMKNLLEIIQNSHDESSNQINDIENKTNDNYKKMVKQIDELMKKMDREIKAIQNKIKSFENPGGNTGDLNIGNDNCSLSESDLKILKDLNRRVNEQERSLKYFTTTINLREINEKIEKLKEELEKKGDQQDLFDLNDKVNKNSLDISNLKDTCDKLIDDVSKTSQDITFTIRKLESLNSTVIGLKSNEESGPTRRDSILDFNKFVEMTVFTEFLKAYAREQDKIKKEIDELRRYLSDHEEILKTKASEDDLKNLEGVLIAKIEEIRLLSNKRYADKIDTSKSIKYLDTQLKHIIEVYVKKMDKGESWLLAKKPIGGFTCASCEAYIGELKDKSDFVAWNKYPMRDSQDKAYRIGNGFSRMLNMLNLDIKNVNDFPEGSERKNNPCASLPSIRPKKNEDIINTSGEVMNTSGQGEEYKSEVPLNPDDPKVVKVYRKNKVSSIEAVPKTSGNQ